MFTFAGMNIFQNKLDADTIVNLYYLACAEIILFDLPLSLWLISKL